MAPAAYTHSTHVRTVMVYTVMVYTVLAYLQCMPASWVKAGEFDQSVNPVVPMMIMCISHDWYFQVQGGQNESLEICPLILLLRVKWGRVQWTDIVDSTEEFELSPLKRSKMVSDCKLSASEIDAILTGNRQSAQICCYP